MSNLLGAALGAMIDRRDGDSGIKGAIVGSLSQRLLGAAVPLVAAVATGWAVLHFLKPSTANPAERAG